MYRIPLGPFEVHHAIGRGGMGEVWKGVHVAGGLPVAVKVIQAEAMKRADFGEVFGNEVRAVAGLDHPGIVVVLDYGVVSEEAHIASGGQMAKGSPYLVMEFAEKGCLTGMMNRLSWPELRTILFDVLDALAHAHARGIIHRDIKPENLLVGCQGADRVKLTDFGLAHIPDRTQRSGTVEDCWGTPLYMAPEQFRGLWRDYGPWTDLYALGVMTFEIVSGQLPFMGETFLDLGKAHVLQPVPELVPRMMQVSEGLEGWVRRLLEKSPRDRFQFAADAAWALEQLGDLPSEGSGEDQLDNLQTIKDSRMPIFSRTELLYSREERAAATVLLSEGRVLDFVQQDLSDAGYGLEQTEHFSQEAFQAALAARKARMKAGLAREGAAEAGGGEDSVAEVLPAWEIPPLPETWRRDESRKAPRPPQLLGAGLGLYGLRAIPMIGRDAYRDHIWQLLREIRERRSARMVLLEGQAGTGKSRLAEWMCERAHEVGAAVVLRAMHSSVPGSSDGLEAMMMRHLGCVQLGRAATLERARQVVLSQGVEDAYEWNALTEMITFGQPLQEDDGPVVPTVKFFSSRQRYAVIYRYLQRVSRERPVMLWLDDIQWGPDTLRFVQYVEEMQSEQPAAILVLMTARSEALREQAAASRLVEELAKSPLVEVRELEPMRKQHSLGLVQHLLGLDGELARQVEERSGGIPLFAVQLVGDWVIRGKLTLGPVGFELRPGAGFTIPDDIHAIWAERLQSVHRAFGRAGQLGLMIAAALGQEVKLAEWAATTALLQVALPAGFLGKLEDDGLVHVKEERMGFAHGMLRESIERTSRESGDWVRVNAACAQMLERRYSERIRGVSERLAWHLDEANLPEHALAPLLAAVELSLEQSDFSKAHSLLDRREALIRRLQLSDSDPALCSGWVRRAETLGLQGRFGESLTVSTNAVQWADREGWQELTAHALLQKGESERHLGRLEDAARSLELAGTTFGNLAMWTSLARCLAGLARVAEQRGDMDQAVEFLMHARNEFEQHGDKLGTAQCLNGLGDIARQRGDFAQARRFSEAARRLSEEIGNLLGVADCVNDIAEWSRLQGDFESALTYCKEAVALYDSLGSEQSNYARINLGLIYLHQGRHEDAYKLLESMEIRLRRHHHWSLLAAVLVAMLTCFGKRGQWTAWDACFEEAFRLLEQTGITDPKIATAGAMAAELARAANYPVRAERVLALANRHTSRVYV